MTKRKTITALSDLTPDTANANKGTERGRYMVEASLTETGAGRSIVADKDGRIIAGNKTLEAWAGMGGAVKVVETDGHELVVVQRTDLDLSDPKGKARKLAYYDNRAGQVGLEWDAEQLLADVNAGVDLAAMFKADEIAELLAGVKGGTDADAEPQIDQAEELNKKWKVKVGDLWRIGVHRLLCGDSTKAADVARVMGGEKAEMVWTDPPYGVAVGDKNKYLNSIARSNRVEANLENDTLDEPGLTAMLCAAFDNAVAVCTAGAAWYVAAPPGPLHVLFGQALKDRGIWRQTIQWVKNNSTFSPMGVCYHWQAEPIFFGWLPNGPHRFYGGRKQTTVWMIDRPMASKEHPTMKPVELVQRAVANSSSVEQVVYEPFAGSGTTLVACENLGRKCRAVEISPAYCAVILERMAQAFPKLEITQGDDAG